MEEVTIRTLDAAGMTPMRAYAALRAKTSGRSSFLIEMSEPDERGEQRSTIGFLARQESAHPPAVDVLRDIAGTALAIAAADARPELASACVRDVAVLVAFDAVLTASGAAPWPDQPFIGRELREMASVVFDHVAGTITLVAANPNVVERCARTIAAAPELDELAPPGASKPEYMIEGPPETVFVKQLARAERRLAMGGLERLYLARTFKSQPRGADLFEVYRALRQGVAARYGYFVDLPSSPMFGAFSAAAVGNHAQRLTAAGDAEALARELLALFPVDSVAGVPTKEAFAALRDIDVGARGMRGGSFVRVRPGGHVEVVRSDFLVTLEEEQFQAVGAAPVVSGRGAEAHTAAAEADTLAALTAMRRAQDAAVAREAAAAAAAAAAEASGEAGAEATGEASAPSTGEAGAAAAGEAGEAGAAATEKEGPRPSEASAAAAAGAEAAEK